MTEKRTLALNARQWRVLLHDNLDVLKATVQQTEVLEEDTLRAFCSQLDNMKMLASAWFQVSPKKEPEPATAEVPVQANGELPKRRGRPPKKRMAPQQVVQ